jgi:ubiquinone/menaquinone biosynthesis C-methylase UbiE
MPSAHTDPRSFDRLAVTFDRFAELTGAPLVDYLTARLPDRGGRAVDLGAGTGQHAVLLAERYDEVLAVDVSAPMLAYARERRPRGNVRYEHRDLRSVTVDVDGPFDLVLSAHTLHHVEDLDATLMRIRGLLRPGGQAMLVDIVDPRRQVPRSAFVRAAVRGLAGDVLHHRRPVVEAVEVFRLSVHPAWLDHVSTDVFLTPAEFAARYGAVFPNAEITAMYRARALHWRHTPPAGAPRTNGARR